MSKRLKNFLKQIENEMSEPSEEELGYIHEEVKQYIVNGIMPENKFAKQLAYHLTKMSKHAATSGALPMMPSEQWRAKFGTRSQDLDWVDDMSEL